MMLQSQGIKEISGTLTYVVATGTKDVDLGTLALKADTRGKELDAEVKSVGKSDRKWYCPFALMEKRSRVSVSWMPRVGRSRSTARRSRT